MSNNDPSADDKWAAFLLHNGSQLKLYAQAGLIFGVLFLLYKYVLFDSAVFGRYLELCALLVAELVNTFYEPGTMVFRADGGLITRIQADNGAFIVVVKESSGVIIASVLAACVLAWSNPPVYRIVGALFAMGWIFCLNILRIAGLLATDIYFPLQLDLMTTWVMPLWLVVGAFIYFYIWMRCTERKK
jgi:exosortase/archaeosortase family protein